MSRVYTFHGTAQGHLHKLRGRPCEDYSASFSAEDDRYHIAAAADGHGAEECFRSAYGSQAAVEIAMECLKEFAESKLESGETEEQFYGDLFSNPRYRQTSIRQLTDTILARWYDRVLADYEENPPGPEEYGEGVHAEKQAESAHDEKEKDKILHIYGSTLMAALQMSKCLILIHQGDGRCDVFYQDGSVEQPIPWDPRCEDTAVTSLCDKDAAASFRSRVINLEERPVIACYLGSDGVEDAYRDTYESLGETHELMGGVHTFYKDLTCRLAELSREEFEAYLKDMLPEFSAEGRFSHSGSGDDVSVAGIVDMEAIPAVTGRFRMDVKRYELEEMLFWKQDALRSKTRKHGILQKRMEEADRTQVYLEAKRNFEEYDAAYQEIAAEIRKLKEEIDALPLEEGGEEEPFVLENVGKSPEEPVSSPQAEEPDDDREESEEETDAIVPEKPETDPDA